MFVQCIVLFVCSVGLPTVTAAVIGTVQNAATRENYVVNTQQGWRPVQNSQPVSNPNTVGTTRNGQPNYAMLNPAYLGQTRNTVNNVNNQQATLTNQELRAQYPQLVQPAQNPSTTQGANPNVVNNVNTQQSTLTNQQPTRSQFPNSPPVQSQFPNSPPQTFQLSQTPSETQLLNSNVFVKGNNQQPTQTNQPTMRVQDPVPQLLNSPPVQPAPTAPTAPVTNSNPQTPQQPGSMTFTVSAGPGNAKLDTIGEPPLIIFSPQNPTTPIDTTTGNNAGTPAVGGSTGSSNPGNTPITNINTVANPAVPQSNNPTGTAPQWTNPNGIPRSTNPFGTAPPSTNPNGIPPSRNPFGTAPPSTNPNGIPPQWTNSMGTAPPSTNPNGIPPQWTNTMGTAPPSTNPNGIPPPSTNPMGTAPPSTNPMGTAPQSNNPTGTALPSTNPAPSNTRNPFESNFPGANPSFQLGGTPVNPSQSNPIQEVAPPKSIDLTQVLTASNNPKTMFGLQTGMPVNGGAPTQPAGTPPGTGPIPQPVPITDFQATAQPNQNTFVPSGNQAPIDPTVGSGTQVGGSMTGTQTPGVPTGTSQGPTGTQVGGSMTGTQTPGAPTGTQVGGSMTGTQTPGVPTGTQVGGSMTGTQTPGVPTGTQVGGSMTGTQTPGAPTGTSQGPTGTQVSGGMTVTLTPGGPTAIGGGMAGTQGSNVPTQVTTGTQTPGVPTGTSQGATGTQVGGSMTGTQTPGVPTGTQVGGSMTGTQGPNVPATTPPPVNPIDSILEAVANKTRPPALAAAIKRQIGFYTKYLNQQTAYYQKSMDRLNNLMEEVRTRNASTNAALTNLPGLLSGMITQPSQTVTLEKLLSAATTIETLKEKVALAQARKSAADVSALILNAARMSNVNI